MTDAPRDIDALLAQPYHAVLATNRRSGPPQLTVVWFLWDGKTFRFSTTTNRAKYHNLRRDPSISLLVEDFGSKWYVAAYGTAEIVTTGHERTARALFAKYLPGRDPAAVATDPARVTVIMHPDRIVTGS